MIPILSTTIVPVGNGVGGLNDAIECRVTNEINGTYELRMRYPITGNHFDEIDTNMIIIASPGINEPDQPFRIYRITKPLNGVVTIYARHISYDMSGIVVTPFSGSDLTSALTNAAAATIPGMQGFTLTTDRTSNNAMSIVTARPLWKLLGGQEGSFLDVYGGEWYFNGQTAKLVTQLGADNGVTVRYGKNLTKLEADSDLSSTYGGVFPFWYGEQDGYIAPSAAVTIPGSPYTRILCLDCSEDFETAPTVAQLQAKANAYITANAVGSPKDSWKISMALLAQSEEYANQAFLEQVALGDTVHVEYADLDINVTARAVKTDWNVLTDQYADITLGRVKQNLADILVGQNQETNTIQKDVNTLKDGIFGSTAVAGKVTVLNASPNDRAELDGDGLRFYNSSGTQSAFYPDEAQDINDFDASMLTGFMYYHDSSTATAPSTQAGRTIHLSNLTGTIRYQLCFENNGTVSYLNTVFPYIRRYNNATGWTKWEYMPASITETITTSGSDVTYDVGNGIYLITTARSNNSSTTQDGLYIASINATSHITAVKAPTGGTAVTVSGRTMTVHAGSANVMVSILRLGP